MNYKTITALVTGGAGFIGSQIAESLLTEGFDVTVVDNLSTGLKENIPVGAQFVQGDVRDYELMKTLASGTDYLFHQAAKVSIRASTDQFQRDADVNLMGTLNILRACKGSRVKKFLFASSMAVYSEAKEGLAVTEDSLTEPISPYGIGKLAAEKYCLLISKNLGIDCVVLRYFNTYGTRQCYSPYVGVITIFITKLLRGESPIIFGNGHQKRDFVHVSDIARANILAMTSNVKSAVFNVGTGRPTSVSAIANLLRSKINSNIDVVYAPDRPDELRISFPDITKAKHEIGYMPRWTLEDKIDEVISGVQSSM